MGDSPFGSEPWMVVPSPNAWPTASTNSKKAWSTNWNTVSPLQKGVPIRPLGSPQQTVTSAQSVSFSSERANEILAPKVDGVTFVDNLSPNAWVAKPSKTPTKQEKQTDDKANIEEELSKQSLYKTELCRSFVDTGNCRYGAKCQFAHGEHELRPVMRHPKYKTEVCKKFSNTGNCPYGNRCRFIHEGITNDENEDDASWSTSWTPTGAYSAVPASPPDSPEKKQQQQLQNKADDARRLAIFERIANT